MTGWLTESTPEEPLAVDGYENDGNYASYADKKIRVDLVLNRKPSTTEQAIAKERGPEGVKYDTRLKLTVAHEDEIPAALGKLARELVDLHKAALAEEAAEKVKREKTLKEIDAREASVREALKAAGLKPKKSKP